MYVPYFTIKHTQNKTLRDLFFFLFSQRARWLIPQGVRLEPDLLATDRALLPSSAVLTRPSTHPFGEWKRKHWALLQGFRVHDGEPPRMADWPRMGGTVYFLCRPLWSLSKV